MLKGVIYLLRVNENAVFKHEYLTDNKSVKMKETTTVIFSLWERCNYLTMTPTEMRRNYYPWFCINSYSKYSLKASRAWPFECFCFGVTSKNQACNEISWLTKSANCRCQKFLVTVSKFSPIWDKPTRVLRENFHCRISSDSQVVEFA